MSTFDCDFDCVVNIPRLKIRKSTLKRNGVRYRPPLPIPTSIRLNECNYDYASLCSVSEDDSGLHSSGGLSVNDKDRKVKGRRRKIRVSGTDEDGYSYVSLLPSEDESESVKDQNPKDVKVIGSGVDVNSPFGLRRCIRLDSLRNGRSVKLIEDFISSVVLPCVPSQLEKLSSESLTMVRKFCGARPDDYIESCDTWTQAMYTFCSLMDKGSPSPVILTGAKEDEAVIRSWELLAHKVIRIRENPDGSLDLRHLQQSLKSLRTKNLFKPRPIIGAFSISCGITGTLRDDSATTLVLHKYGAQAFWNMSMVASTSRIEMNPKTGNASLDKLIRKDGIFFGPEAFIGCPQASGALVISSVPRTMNFEERGQNQSQSQSIKTVRLGLVLKFHEIIGNVGIREKEIGYTKKALDALSKIPEIHLLFPKGNYARLSFISFLVRHKDSGLLIHQGFIQRVLSDFFGIQIERFDIAFDNPIFPFLFEVDPLMKKRLDKSHEPGYLRISFPSHLSEEQVTFAIEGIKFAATEGWKLLPLYKLDYLGCWTFIETDDMECPDLNLSYRPTLSSKRSLKFEECIKIAKKLINDVRRYPKGFLRLPISQDSMRWFVSPSEAELYNQGISCIRSRPIILRIRSRPTIPVKPVYTPGSIPYQFISNSDLQDKLKWNNSLDVRLSERNGEERFSRKRVISNSYSLDDN